MKPNSKLRAARREQQLAQAALAVRARVSPGLIVAIERYGHYPRPETRERIAVALGVRVDQLWPTSRDGESSMTRT